MTSQTSEPLDAVLEQAAIWHARMDCGTGDQAEFERWRDADPRNAAAFARVLGAAERVRGLKPVLKHRAHHVSRRALISSAVAACAFATFGGGVFVMLNHRASAQTAVGDQELRRLPDGGKLHINTNSKVQWRFSGQRREVWLNQGEIALNVPEDARPLYLYAADQVVELRSGQLNARLRNGALDLLMLEGQAEVQEDGRSGKVRVATGQAALAGSANIRLRPMSPGDIQFVSAWQAGEIYFNGETLGAAVDEYNRYLPYKIVIGDPSLQGVRLGGRFKSHDPQLFLTSLRDSFGVVASRTSDGTVVLTL